QAALNSSLRANERARFVDSHGMRNGDAPGILAELDDDQRAAAITVEGPLLVVAGPGSGKTRMLTYRIAHLIAERGVAADNCLAITFTRRAAGEIDRKSVV